MLEVKMKKLQVSLHVNYHKYKSGINHTILLLKRSHQATDQDIAAKIKPLLDRHIAEVNHITRVFVRNTVEEIINQLRTKNLLVEDQNDKDGRELKLKEEFQYIKNKYKYFSRRGTYDVRKDIIRISSWHAYIKLCCKIMGFKYSEDEIIEHLNTEDSDLYKHIKW